MVDDNKKGFSGLGDLFSDVHVEEIAPQEKPITEGTEKKSAGDSPKPPEKSSKAGLWWILGIVFVIWVVSQGDSSKHTSGNTSSYNNSSTYNYNTNAEEKPSVGSNLAHTKAEIRYCLSEEIRLNAIESNINKYDDSEIAAYNAAIADYNSRCSSYRYRSGDLESVRRQVEANRTTLVAQGLNRLKAWQPIAPQIDTTTTVSSPSASSIPDSQSAKSDRDFETTIADPNIYVGKYSYVARNKTSAGIVEISKLPDSDDGKKLYKISLQVATKSGCTGEVQGAGTAINDVMAFALGDGKKCFAAAKLDPSENILNLEESKECNYYHGMNCGFTGQYQREQQNSTANNDVAVPNGSSADRSAGKDDNGLPDPVLIKAINEIAGQLPMKMGDVTLENVKAEGNKTLVYMYRITGNTNSFSASESAPKIFDHWCKSDEGAAFRKINAVILYLYFDMQGAPVEEIKVPTKDCK